MAAVTVNNVRCPDKPKTFDLTREVMAAKLNKGEFDNNFRV